MCKFHMALVQQLAIIETQITSFNTTVVISPPKGNRIFIRITAIFLDDPLGGSTSVIGIKANDYNDALIGVLNSYNPSLYLSLDTHGPLIYSGFGIAFQAGQGLPQLMYSVEGILTHSVEL